MNNFCWLTKVALRGLACIAQPAAAQTLLRVATPGALTGALPIYLGPKASRGAQYQTEVAGAGIYGPALDQ